MSSLELGELSSEDSRKHDILQRRKGTENHIGNEENNPKKGHHFICS